MKYFNLKVSVLLRQNLTVFETYEKISNLISFAMLKDEKLKQLHKENIYKNYVFCNLYPVPKDAIYSKNNIYSFDIRGIDFNVIMKIKQVLSITENEFFKVIQINVQTNIQREINKLITLTPVIITTEKGDYDIKADLVFVKKRILDNIQKKYKSIYGSKIDLDFIKEIKKTNRVPIKIPYKNINILGNKFEITVKDDPMSQNLAFLMLSIGCGEKNSIGFGFCRAR